MAAHSVEQVVWDALIALGCWYFALSFTLRQLSHWFDLWSLALLQCSASCFSCVLIKQLVQVSLSLYLLFSLFYPALKRSWLSNRKGECNIILCYHLDCL
ncbi:hypothetical protein BJ165DRAFT_166095 [Panaeolus papilionaceus]|nr:hypothetical protein BJ165DRAFT_166095 [Panaeolus papilionaceus]